MPASPWIDIEAASASLVHDLAAALLSRHLRLATAESCTGGLIAACCTALSGSSDWFDRGVVTYSNAAKSDLLGVPASLIETHGAVSSEVACAMAQGLLGRCSADVVVAVTGIAGPGGGSLHKPVGTVWLAWGTRWGGVQAELLSLSGDRRAIRHVAVIEALGKVITVCPEGPAQAPCDGR